jgi:hypothetical protein
MQNIEFHLSQNLQISMPSSIATPRISTRPKQYREGDLIMMFNLKPIKSVATPLMQEWLDAPPPIFTASEQELFDKRLDDAVNKIEGWSEEDLKMKFIAFMLDLGQLFTEDEQQVVTFFDKKISATVEGIKLTVKSDFMMAKGVLDAVQAPYFHFQEYKPFKNPSGDSRAQLLEAFLIAQTLNDNGKPLYGLEIIGKSWSFVVMQGKEYCVSQPFICTERGDLMQIFGMFRLFKHIMKTRLMVD